MSNNFSLQDIKVIGEWEDSNEVINQLEAINKSSEAIAYSTSQDKSKDGDIFSFFRGVKKEPWYAATHQYGYIPFPSSGNNQPQAIINPSTIEADQTLKNSRINIRLDRLRVYRYPGKGTHNIMVTFEALNQVADAIRDNLRKLSRCQEKL